MSTRVRAHCALLSFLFVVISTPGFSQSLGASGAIQGTVTDPSGAVIPGAQVTISNPVTHYQATVTTDGQGKYAFRNVPFNHYHLVATAQGFQNTTQDTDVQSAVAIALDLQLAIGASSTDVEVSAEDLIEAHPITHTDVDQSLIDRLPLPTASAGLSAVIQQAAPGVVSDSNGMFHPQGEHADTSFVVDNQPVTDQQSRTFSNQLSSNVIQSMEMITGVAPAEFGDKSSLVVRTSTKSGLGLPKPTGSINTGYSSFGTSDLSFNTSVGNDTFGNFIAIDGMNGGRFLDTPEFRPLHDKGNAENLFDRLDYKFTDHDQLHLNLSLAHTWFQTPNTYDQQSAGQDQRQLVRSFNFAPGLTHIINNATLLTANAYIRQDRVGYFPSGSLFLDQPATLSQTRRLTNAGLKVDLSYVKGIHNAKFGAQFSHTLLSEYFQTGLTDPLFNAPCIGSDGAPVPAIGVTDPGNCAVSGFAANPDFGPGLLPYDLTRGGRLFTFQGRTDIKQEAVYAQDSITIRNLTVMLGARFDNYNGLSSGSGLQPRVGLSYLIKPTTTVLRASYGRFFLTPYNENLILSSATGQGGLLTGTFGGFGETPLTPARRNHFEVGLQQGIGKYLVVDGSYFWKFTNDDYDFDVLLNTPLAFPIQWRKSKIDGVSVRVNFPERHGFSAYSVMGHTRARFFGPEVGGILFNSPVSSSVFRIDHDQAFQQNTHVQWQPSKRSPWVGFTWSYQSGEVAGSVPDLATALGFSGDEQAQIGLFCGSSHATVSTPIRSCGSNLGVTRLRIPQAGTEDDDRNPPRIAPRNLFDASVGMDDIFHGDRYKWSLQLTAVNLTNEAVLYNFLSTFSGTHFVSPRTLRAEIGFHF